MTQLQHNADYVAGASSATFLYNQPHTFHTLTMLRTGRDNIYPCNLDTAVPENIGKFVQKALSEQTSADEKKLAEMKQKTNGLRLLLQTLRKCTDITELNRELVNRLIQRIEVYSNDKYDSHCHVK